MATAPDCNKNTQRARMRRAGHLGHNKADAEWAKKLESNKYPTCVGKNQFDDCPESLDDTNNPHSGCRSCPQYVPSFEERKKKM